MIIFLGYESSRTKTVTVNANDGVSLSFLIKPVIVGPMTIKVIKRVQGL